MVALLELEAEKYGYSITVVGATEAGDGITDGNWDGFFVSCNEGMVDEMIDRIRVGRVFPE